jgi:ParB/RepB/Spo0J family partition protein
VSGGGFRRGTGDCGFAAPVRCDDCGSVPAVAGLIPNPNCYPTPDIPPGSPPAGEPAPGVRLPEIAMTPPDDLAERAGTSGPSHEIAVKALTWFLLADQVRRQATDAADALLTESIRRHGVLQPVGARPDGKLVWGHRRLRCATAAGLTDIPTVVLLKAMTEGEFLVLQMLENVQRADLAPHDLWQGCVRLLESNKGWQLKDVARALSLDPSSVTRILSPSKVIPAAVEALKAGRINLGHTYALCKVDDPQEQERLLNLSLAGASRDALEAEARKLRQPLVPSVRLARVKVALPAGVRLVVSGREALSLDDLIDSLTEAQKEAKRARDQGMDAKTFAAAMKCKARMGGA